MIAFILSVVFALIITCYVAADPEYAQALEESSTPKRLYSKVFMTGLALNFAIVFLVSFAILKILAYTCNLVL